MKNSVVRREFAKYASLNVLGMIGLSCYILADTFFVSKRFGADGLAALNLAIPIYSFIHGSGLMIGMGGGSRYSILQGQNNKDTANRVFTKALYFAAGLSVIFFAASLLFPEEVARLLGAKGVVLDMSAQYLQTILLFAPAFLFNNVLLCFVRNDKAPGLSMAGMIGGSLSNIVLDYLFMFPLNMGMFGAALATGLAPVISILILSPFFMKKKNQFHPVRRPLSGGKLGGIVSSGLPSLVAEVSQGIVMIVFNTVILGLKGNIGVAAYGVIANLSLVVIAVYSGIAQGIQPILSRYSGAGKASDVRAVLRYALISMTVLSGLIYLVVFFGAPQIAGIFNSAQDKNLQAVAVTGLKIYFTSCLFAGFNIILSMYFTSIQRVFPAHVISILRGFVIVIPSAFALSGAFGMTGVWCAVPVTELLVSAAALWMLLAGTLGDRGKETQNG